MSSQLGQLARAFALTGSLFLSGFSFSASQLGAPPAYNQSVKDGTATLGHLYYEGAKTVVPLGLLSTAAAGYAAYALPQVRLTLAAASICTLGSLPWTRFVMMPNIQKLLDLSNVSKEEQEKTDRREVVAMLKKWHDQNYARAGMYFAGGALIISTIL